MVLNNGADSASFLALSKLSTEQLQAFATAATPRALPRQQRATGLAISSPTRAVSGSKRAHPDDEPPASTSQARKKKAQRNSERPTFSKVEELEGKEKRKLLELCCELVDVWILSSNPFPSRTQCIEKSKGVYSDALKQKQLSEVDFPHTDDNLAMVRDNYHAIL